MQNMDNTKNDTLDVGDLLIYEGWITPLEYFNLFYFKEGGRLSYNKIPNAPKLMDRTEIKKGSIFLIVDIQGIHPNMVRFDFLFDNKRLYLLIEDGGPSQILSHFKKIECKNE